MRTLRFLPLVLLFLALAPVARAQGGVVIRPSGPCSPTLPGEVIVMYNTTSRRITAYITVITNGVSSELTQEILPNAQLELGCSIHGLEQRSWVLKSFRQTVVLPARR